MIGSRLLAGCSSMRCWAMELAWPLPLICSLCVSSLAWELKPISPLYLFWHKVQSSNSWPQSWCVTLRCLPRDSQGRDTQTGRIGARTAGSHLDNLYLVSFYSLLSSCMIFLTPFTSQLPSVAGKNLTMSNCGQNHDSLEVSFLLRLSSR